MASTKDVKFKYVNNIPQTVEMGAFYWKIGDNGNENQLYFSPSEDKDKILRLDNIKTDGETQQNGDFISLVGTYDKNEQLNIQNEDGSLDTFTDKEWEMYLVNNTTSVGEIGLYGNLSHSFFNTGNVIIYGDREFICTGSDPVFEYLEEDGKKYYKTKDGKKCIDKDGNPIEMGTKPIPMDAAVDSYESIEWKCFGENLSTELAEKLENFDISSGTAITVTQGDSDYGYVISAVICDSNPLKIKTDGGEITGVVYNTDITEAIAKGTLMSVDQIKELLDAIAKKETIWKTGF